MNIQTLAASKGQSGFTLVEMLTVIALAGILAALTMPAVQGLQKADRFSQSVYSIADSLSLARTYAMAKNTYVYVAMTEVDCSQNPSATPQSPGVGRVAVSIVATNDGTSDINSWSTTGSNVVQVQPVQSYDFLHVASTGSFLTSTAGKMQRPLNITSSPTLIPIPAANAPALQYSLPLGSTVGTGKYNFTDTHAQMICFNPRGEVLLPQTSSGVTLSPVQWVEIDLQPTVGAVTPSAPSNVNQGNQAALVIGGVSGAVTVYRP